HQPPPQRLTGLRERQTLHAAIGLRWQALHESALLQAVGDPRDRRRVASDPTRHFPHRERAAGPELLQRLGLAWLVVGLGGHAREVLSHELVQFEDQLPSCFVSRYLGLQPLWYKL